MRKIMMTSAYNSIPLLLLVLTIAGCKTRKMTTPIRYPILQRVSIPFKNTNPLYRWTSIPLNNEFGKCAEPTPGILATGTKSNSGKIQTWLIRVVGTHTVLLKAVGKQNGGTGNYSKDLAVIDLPHGKPMPIRRCTIAWVGCQVY